MPSHVGAVEAALHWNPLVAEGNEDGAAEGLVDADGEGNDVGRLVGLSLGEAEGVVGYGLINGTVVNEGAVDGEAVGQTEGAGEGDVDGSAEGPCVGGADGVDVGAVEGLAVGTIEGRE